MDCKIIARPNNSLSPENSLKLMVVLAIVAFVVALGFAHVGAWLVLPFAGLELAAFAYAFYYVYLHSSDFESIAIDGDRVIIEKRSFRETSVTEFQRYWMQVHVRNIGRGKGVVSKSGLFIGSHGKEVEFGKHFINDEQRVALAHELKQKLKSIN
ncbi:DUF2244 domain-containing protein [Methylotenera versatilis]|uniref:DUF2244 domain-containing protein n=1 Tax=Methylotenera versatilis TaxID=1055487 RepID=UPI001F37DE12|nr:DUF2244 domain-containing protein [Methylotenera versatilis]